MSLAGPLGEGEIVTVELNLEDLTTNPDDHADIITAIETAADNDPNVSFDPSTGTLTYTSPADGETMDDLVIDLPITDDSLIEGPESFTISLSNPTTTTDANVDLDPTDSEVTTVINDTQGDNGPLDGPAQWSIAGPSDVDEGSTPQYTISLDGTFGEDEVVSVDVSLLNGSTSPDDYDDFVAALKKRRRRQPQRHHRH